MTNIYGDHVAFFSGAILIDETYIFCKCACESDAHHYCLNIIPRPT